LALQGWAATAQTAPAAAAPATPLAEITLTATRTERRVDEVPATVSVTTAQEAEAAGATDLHSLFRTAVDLSVRRGPTRFGATVGTAGRAGNEGLNIRGLEGNQVLMLVDGVRVPAAFGFGPLSTGRGEYFSLETTQAVEVLRGPASTQFGSDGLAGAFSLRTLEPSDLLGSDAKTARTTAGFVRLGHDTADQGTVLTGAGAWRSGPWQGLVLASTRQSHAVDNPGTNDSADSTRTRPNPQDNDQRALLAKLQWQVSPAHRLGLTLDLLQRDTAVNVLTGRTPVTTATPASTAVLDLRAEDRTERQRLSLTHRFDDLNAVWAQRGETQLTVQRAGIKQFSAEDRYSAADRTRRGEYEEQQLALNTHWQTQLGGDWPQRLSYGVDASVSDISAQRDGTPNPTAAPPFGETFPNKPFPDTRYSLLGAFVQSELQLGAVALTPALRFDRYALSPSSDGYTGTLVKLQDQAVTPRLGAVWRVHSAFVPYAQWSQGFRAPTPAQVNSSFSNVAAGYVSIGNAELKPEHANSREIGLRGQAGGWRWQAAAFDNRYRDFISQETVGGSGTSADPTVFQSINLTSARITGMELRASWQASAAWALELAHAQQRGHSERNGVRTPLDSVDPARTALGLRWQALPTLDLRADLTHRAAKAREDIGANASTAFAPEASTVLDLGLRWQPAPGWTTVLRLNNATDETYWHWADVRGLASTSTVLDSYAATGRSWQLTLRRDF
jgi:hemoglobin/transferrin/lactoferrin receptor protein